MADPISIIKLVAVALSTAKATKDFIDDVVDAPNVVNSVARDLESLQGVLSQLVNHLQNPVFGDVQAHDQITTMLTAPLENCAEESRNLQTLIRPFIKPSSKAKKSKWTRLAFQFKADEVRNIQQRLSNSRASLDAGVGIATLIISSRTSGRLQEMSEEQNTIKRRMNRLLLDRGLDVSSVATSTYAASNTGDTVMNWLAETETVVGEEPLDVNTTRYRSVIRSPDVTGGTFLFKWPHPGAKEVHVTGTFDEWGKSEQLNKVGDTWEKEVNLPSADEKIYYKFVVDDRWIIDPTAPQEDDGHFNVNNILLPKDIKKHAGI